MLVGAQQVIAVVAAAQPVADRARGIGDPRQAAGRIAGRDHEGAHRLVTVRERPQPRQPVAVRRAVEAPQALEAGAPAQMVEQEAAGAVRRIDQRRARRRAGGKAGIIRFVQRALGVQGRGREPAGIDEGAREGMVAGEVEHGLAQAFAHIRYNDKILTPAYRKLMDDSMLGWEDPAVWTQLKGKYGDYLGHGGLLRYNTSKPETTVGMVSFAVNYPSGIQAVLLVNSLGSYPDKARLMRDAFDAAVVLKPMIKN